MGRWVGRTSLYTLGLSVILLLEAPSYLSFFGTLRLACNSQYPSVWTQVQGDGHIITC